VLKIGRGLAYIGFLLMPALYLRLWRNFNFSDIFFLAAFFIFITTYTSQALFAVVKNPLNIPLFIFFLGFSLSLMVSEQPIEGFFALIQLLFCIYIVTTIIYFCDIKRVLRMIVITIALHAILLILFIVKVLNIGIIKQGWGNIRLSFGNVEPNIAARVFFIGFVIMIFSLHSRWWLWLKIVTLYSTLATVSRSGLLALVILFIGKWKFIATVLAIVLMVIIFGLVGYVPPVININIIHNYIGRISNLLHMSGESELQRMYMYTEGPILFFGKYFFVGTGINDSFHSVMISVAIGNGIFGLIGYLLIYVIILVVAWSLERKFSMLMALVLGTFVFDMFMPVSENRIYWFPFSLTIAVYLQHLSFSRKHNSDKATIEPNCSKLTV
jgi:hypothetical protein